MFVGPCSALDPTSVRYIYVSHAYYYIDTYMYYSLCSNPSPDGLPSFRCSLSEQPIN